MIKKTKTDKPSIHSIKECPDCASLRIVYNEEREQVICRDCGLIYEPMAPVLEQKFESTHGFGRRPEAKEKVMIKLEEEKPKKAKKKPVQKKAAKKPAKPAEKKKPAQKAPAPKPAKKHAEGKKGIFNRLKSSLKKKKRGAFSFF